MSSPFRSSTLLTLIISGNSESLTITSEKSQLAKTDLARMVYEAQGFSERDQEFRECAAALNELQKLVGLIL